MQGLRESRSMLLVLALAALLLTFCLLAASCGAGGTGSGKEGENGGGSGVTIESRQDIDAYLEELDSKINSVDPEDFSERQLSDSELGI